MSCRRSFNFAASALLSIAISSICSSCPSAVIAADDCQPNRDKLPHREGAGEAEECSRNANPDAAADDGSPHAGTASIVSMTSATSLSAIWEEEVDISPSITILHSTPALRLRHNPPPSLPH